MFFLYNIAFKALLLYSSECRVTRTKRKRLAKDLEPELHPLQLKGEHEGVSKPDTGKRISKELQPQT